MTDWLLWCLLALAALNTLGCILWLALGLRSRARADGAPQLMAAVASLTASSERMERELRSEVQASARDSRAELTQSLSLFQQALLAQSGDVARTQNEQIDSFRVQLGTTQQQLMTSLASARDAQDMALKRFADGLNEQLRQVTEGSERKLGEVRLVVEQRLTALQDGNEKKLDQMRATVDEKLQTTLEARLGQSFKQVADRLEQVHKGLGEMQTLAAGVGDLKHLLTNVKTRGIFGEAQLAGLLEQVFVVDQYAAQVATRPGSRNVVDFAIKLPGKSEQGHPLWLPIDAKFPNEDYERLLDAQGRADLLAAEAAGKALESRIRLEARAIADKYVEPPYTTDFAILFLPTEGLYAEVLRRPGLMEALQREHRITLAGPTTLLAMLSSLQMGFRTLALEKRSSEVWQVLGAVKTEFGKFGDVLAKVKTQTETVLKTIDGAETRSRAMGRALKKVEALPDLQAQAFIPVDKDFDQEPDAG
jgi:DNA recombination protein RmuC